MADTEGDITDWPADHPIEEAGVNDTVFPGS
jgi:hypothetical protein